MNPDRLTSGDRVWYHPGGMIDKPPDDRDPSCSPHWIWGALIAAWAALVYVLFFINLVRDYLAWRGGG